LIVASPMLFMWDTLPASGGLGNPTVFVLP